jgi:hypothetical protein
MTITTKNLQTIKLPGILSVIISGASCSSPVSQLQTNVGVMVQFIPPISAFAGLLALELYQAV